MPPEDTISEEFWRTHRTPCCGQSGMFVHAAEVRHPSLYKGPMDCVMCDACGTILTREYLDGLTWVPVAS